MHKVLSIASAGVPRPAPLIARRTSSFVARKPPRRARSTRAPPSSRLDRRLRASHIFIRPSAPGMQRS
eukprot:CAMPEP_0172570828 /NCGR_PEP_ID=MMETSP1067-20121228/129045_1 /TAXON_ID=265564 ORGANISM="Thalassiosira punctigera, Strain Tpunct2005C2" /NCGR_SAMPLE_ID=MMETSP1067 /ASSEMBLY_ACC=CAM_ASM_000444 /LENGTH=67 /DNA_ID=CAMNT_0013363019 /DNA_START=151 /DNA_END=351 /DNA_ORIENTATION=-